MTELPKGWEQLKLGKLFSVKIGKKDANASSQRTNL
jgi:hypothetical protein